MQLKALPTCLDVASFPLMLKVAKITNTICGTHIGAADVAQMWKMCAQITDDFMVQQESIPVGCVLPTFLVLVGSPHRCRPPWIQTLLEVDLPPPRETSQMQTSRDEDLSLPGSRPLWVQTPSWSGDLSCMLRGQPHCKQNHTQV